MSDLERLTEALEKLGTGYKLPIASPNLDIVKAAARVYRDLLANGEQVEWCEEHRDVKWKDSPGCHMRRSQNFPNECRIVSRLLVDPPKEERQMDDWPIVSKLNQAQIRKLESHRHDRGLDGWMDEEPHWLLQRLREEVEELAANPSWEEAADVANFAAMFVEQSR